MRYLTAILIGLFLLISFSCEGQTTVKISEDCDTVTIENLQYEKEKAAFKKTIDSLTYRNTILLGSNQALAADNQAKADTIQSQEDTIKQQSAQIENQALQISTLLDENDRLKEELANSGSSPDSITVGGVRYAVADIKYIRPEVERDTITVTTCWSSPQDSTKFWLHAGDQNTWPHRVYFPTKELEMIGPEFDSLSQESKIYQYEYKLLRLRNYKEAGVTYKNLYIDPKEYLPDSLK